MNDIFCERNVDAFRICAKTEKMTYVLDKIKVKTRVLFTFLMQKSQTGESCKGKMVSNIILL